MKTVLAVIISSLAALAVQPVVMFVWFVLPHVLMGAEMPWLELGPIFFYTVLFAIPFVLFLGIPFSLFLRKFGRLRWWPLALTGAMAGTLLVGWDAPGGDPGFSSGGNWYGRYVDFVVAGEPTLYGWLRYFQSILAFAAHGFFGATAYYLVLVGAMRPNGSFKPTPLRSAA